MGPMGRYLILCLTITCLLTLATGKSPGRKAKKSFIILRGDGKVAKIGGARKPVCCVEAGLLACTPADIDVSALGRRKLFLPPSNIRLDFIGSVGGDNRTFHYRGEAGAHAVITCSGNKRGGGCNGNAIDAAGDVYVLEYCGAEGHVWKQPDMEAFVDHMPRQEGERDALSAGSTNDLDSTVDIDYVTPVSYSIKFYYTPEFAAATPDISGFVRHVVTVTNLGYIHSQVPLHAVALCTELASSLSEKLQTRDANAMLRDFAAHKGGNLANVRDTADVAVLLVMGFGPEDNTCGMGYLNSIAAGKTLSTVRKSCAWSYYTVGHEIGHNLGLDHDPDHAKDPPYPYGTGHLIEGSGDSDDEDSDSKDGGVGDDEDAYDDESGYRTIMSYPSDGYPTRVNHYSNPNVLLLASGTPTGTKTSNNALVLLKNRFRLAVVGDESSATCKRDQFGF